MVCSVYAGTNNITVTFIVWGGGGRVREPFVKYVYVGLCLICRRCVHIVGRGCCVWVWGMGGVGFCAILGGYKL